VGILCASIILRQIHEENYDERDAAPFECDFSVVCCQLQSSNIPGLTNNWTDTLDQHYIGYCPFFLDM
jgi:hypothetical protein